MSKPQCGQHNSTTCTFLSLRKASATRRNAQFNRLKGRTDRGHSSKLKGTTGESSQRNPDSEAWKLPRTIDSSLEQIHVASGTHDHRLKPGVETFVETGMQSDGGSVK